VTLVSPRGLSQNTADDLGLRFTIAAASGRRLWHSGYRRGRFESGIHAGDSNFRRGDSLTRLRQLVREVLALSLEGSKFIFCTILDD
jgi:hypothetical protein